MDAVMLGFLSAITMLLVVDLRFTIANARAVSRLEQAFKDHLRYLHGVRDNNE